MINLGLIGRPFDDKHRAPMADLDLHVVLDESHPAIMQRLRHVVDFSRLKQRFGRLIARLSLVAILTILAAS